MYVCVAFRISLWLGSFSSVILFFNLLCPFLLHICSLILHVVLLQEKKLLDLPKLLDICAIYGHENEGLTRILVSNFIE